MLHVARCQGESAEDVARKREVRILDGGLAAVAPSAFECSTAVLPCSHSSHWAYRRSADASIKGWPRAGTRPARAANRPRAGTSFQAERPARPSGAGRSWMPGGPPRSTPEWSGLLPSRLRHRDLPGADGDGPPGSVAGTRADLLPETGAGAFGSARPRPVPGIVPTCLPRPCVEPLRQSPGTGHTREHLGGRGLDGDIGAGTRHQHGCRGRRRWGGLRARRLRGRGREGDVDERRGRAADARQEQRDQDGPWVERPAGLLEQGLDGPRPVTSRRARPHPRRDGGLTSRRPR